MHRVAVLDDHRSAARPTARSLPDVLTPHPGQVTESSYGVRSSQAVADGTASAPGRPVRELP